jgi:hypothetical protein
VELLSTHKIYSLPERLSDTIHRRMFPVLQLVISPDLQIIKSKDEDRDILSAAGVSGVTALEWRLS